MICRRCKAKDEPLDPQWECMDRGACWERIVNGAVRSLEYAPIDKDEQKKIYEQSPKMGDTK